ncbi:MFS transporter [Parabacteroides distasonis]|uniref:MFS transporter n=2 Tax=Parabacteroides distasonis TaxID=823 RepID=UPI00189D569B|nr:MFS transporter [Parabacteroides distasonis]MDB9154054.1 MFS transporter [Parabacteroides distasonis]MDB9158619.1 MFS transporter [Parabacteroides distasonis]MDB9167396.1 MFS transporter [Parabacteroides distasonis]MDB9171906.1 MFS transporter [Parabacteroides distasonis]MDB9194152.1 MFS transporter [Parabacteroides distasonis]
MDNWKRVFAIIWTGQFLSILTSSIVNFAIVLWLSLETGSAEVLAFATMAALLPQSVLGLFTGIFIDRWKRKRVMIMADSFIAFCTLILAVLFYFDLAKISHIYVLLALRSVGSAFHMPAMQASVPLLAPKSELMRIAGINQVIQSVCNIAGPALAGLFITMMKMTNILLLDVAGAAFACLSLCFVFIPDPSHEERNSELHLWREAKEAIMEVRNQYGLSWLFLLSILATFVIMPVSVLFPLMTLNHFAGNAFQVSLVEVSWGGGALLAGALLGLKKYHWNEILLINGMYIALGLTFLFSGLLPISGFIWFVVLTALGGVCGSLYFATFTTVIQSRINPGVMGRVFSFYMSFSMLPSMIGLLSTGFLADSIGLGNTFIISGGFLCLIGIISFFIPSLISLKESFKR